MAIVRKANVVLKVTDAEIYKYLARGYKVIDEDGNVVREAEPNDIASLKEAYVKHLTQITKLEEEVASLKKELAKLKKKAKAEKDE